MYEVIRSNNIETSTGQDVYVCHNYALPREKSPKERLALWHLHYWHLDVPPKAYNSRREIQEPKGPVLSCKSTCQSTRETIGNNSALKKLAERSRSSRNSHQQKWNTCQGFVSLLILASQPILIASACGLLINPLETYKQSGTVCVEGSMKSMFESVVRRCTKYLKAMTSRQAPAKMFMYARNYALPRENHPKSACLVAFTILAPRRPTKSIQL